MMTQDREDVPARDPVVLLQTEETVMMVDSVTIDVVEETMTERDHTAPLVVEVIVHPLGSVVDVVPLTHIRTETASVTLKLRCTKCELSPALLV